MALRFFTLQMMPWCFQLMGSQRISRAQLRPNDQAGPICTIKLVKSDGLVLIYHRPIHVSEVMTEFPKHQVCRSDSLYIGQKIPALSEDDQLQLGHKYFLLPQQFFQSVLSFVTIASFSSKDSSRNAFVRKAASCKPFDIQKTPSGCLRIRVSDEFISQLLEEKKLEDDAAAVEAKSGVCTTAQLQKDYTQLVGARQWKPRLEPIRESREKSRKLSSFGLRRSSKKKSQPNSSKASQKQKSSSTNGSSKAKIKIKSSRK
ncbi:hypothetical protein FF1_021615 [Malus domestica]|uniref:uncharacterized protein LOC126607263 n=1 Tax=Malus sylvestris TaxID=3752 RepID=UPI0021AC3B77|nr:uncharacterized protein LOC126607263 [Malus sylvestris]